MAVSSAHELFALDPKDFVRERDALAKQLRANGDRDAAAQVKALRRPTVAAWAINAVARDEPEAVRALLDAAADARAARAGDALRNALATRRNATAQVMRAVRDVLSASGRDRDAHDRDVESLLNDAFASDAAAVLERGALTGAEADADEGDLLASLSASVPQAAPRRERVRKPEPAPPRPSPALVRAQHDVEKAEEKLRDAEQRVRDAQAALDDARRRVDELS